MNNYWSADSILNNQTEETVPREIHQAVCDAIGAYFIDKQFKYARATPKIWFKDNDYKLEIVFRSSGSNYAGGIINLEINAYLYSLENPFPSNSKLFDPGHEKVDETASAVKFDMKSKLNLSPQVE